MSAETPRIEVDRGGRDAPRYDRDDPPRHKNNNNNSRPQSRKRDFPPRKKSQPLSDRQRERPPLPSGQHLSKTSSKIKNDPLYLESFMPASGEELVPIAEEVNHYTGFSGLKDLINESYEQICSHSKNFKESVSSSMYSYYIAVITWTRALNLMKKNRYSITTEERALVDIIYEEAKYVIPKSIAIYLSGIGNTTISSGVESKFKLKPYTLSAATGYFANYETQFYLATDYLCVSTYAERICEDIRVTQTPGPATWEPNDIVQVWNENTLGYADATNLGPRILSTLLRLGISSDFATFDSAIDVYKINIPLMNAVEKYLKEVPQLDVTDIPSEINGSTGQFIIEIPRNTIVSSVAYTSKSPLQITGSISYLGGSFLYRVKKDLSIAQAKGLFPYTIAPTAAQIAVLNTLQIGWSPIFNSIYHYENVLPFIPRLRDKKIIALDFHEKRLCNVRDGKLVYNKI